MMRFRKWNQLRAWFGGYFWINCPACGQMFGGHEWRDIDGKPSHIPVDSGPGWGTSRGICPDCTRKGLGRDSNAATYQAIIDNHG